jgi:hypothetical protein
MPDSSAIPPQGAAALLVQAANRRLIDLLDRIERALIGYGMARSPDERRLRAAQIRELMRRATEQDEFLPAFVPRPRRRPPPGRATGRSLGTHV